MVDFVVISEASGNLTVPTKPVADASFPYANLPFMSTS